jgi:hypothetical protein
MTQHLHIISNKGHNCSYSIINTGLLVTEFNMAYKPVFIRWAVVDRSGVAVDKVVCGQSV